MGISANRLLPIFIVLAPFIINYQFFFVVLLGFVLWGIWKEKGKIERNIFNVVLISSLILFGLFFSWQWEIRDIFRDCLYLLSPVVLLLSGWTYARRNQGGVTFLFEDVVKSGWIFAIYFLLKYLYLDIELGANFVVVRQEIGTGSAVVAIGLALLFIPDYRSRVNMSKLAVLFCVVTLFLVLCLFYSRTWWFCFLFFFIFSFALLKVGLRVSVLLAVLVGVVVFPVLNGFYNMGYSSGGWACDSFVCKLGNTFQEVLVRNYYASRDLHQHWRGYETYSAMRQFYDAGIAQQLLGQGLGALIDVGESVQLGQHDSENIPLLHNGYVYVLVKAGVVGLLIYLVQFLVFLNIGLKSYFSAGSERRMVGVYILTSTILLLMTSFFIAGFFNRAGLVPMIFFMGAALYISSSANVFRE